MRLLKLSLVLLGIALSVAPATAQTLAATPSPDSQIQIAPAPQAQSPYNYAQNGPRQVQPDRHINILPRLMTDRDPVCYKLRKYIFRRSDGGDALAPAGQTDCTYSSKVWPKSAGNDKPAKPDVGVYSAVSRSK